MAEERPCAYVNTSIVVRALLQPQPRCPVRLHAIAPVGKVVAGVYWLLGLDLPLFTVYWYYEGYGYAPVFTVTANTAIFTLLLLTNALAWPEVKRELGIRGGPLPGLPAGPRRRRA